MGQSRIAITINPSQLFKACKDMIKRILLIDDVASIRHAFMQSINPPLTAQERLAQLINGKALVRETHLTDEASQGEEGVEKARAAIDSGSPYDIVIVDMRMPPGIDGCETIRRIREFDHDVFIAVCTADTKLVAGDIAPANDGVPPLMLFKPLDPNRLSQVVASAARKRA